MSIGEDVNVCAAGHLPCVPDVLGALVVHVQMEHGVHVLHADAGGRVRRDC